MKTIILYISLLFFITSQSSQAQITQYAALPLTCLSNGDFPNACVSGTSCDAWSSSCSAGWFRSHGSPTMATYTENGQPKYYIYVWAQGTNNGEGVFTDYYFQNNYTYGVRIRTSSNGTGGKAWIYAANGLTEPATVNSCGSGLPNITDKQAIGYIDGNAGNEYREFTYTNTSGTLFTQLWIYPERTGGSQYDLNILSVEVCPVCYSSITFNSGVVPSGTTTKGYIYGGSSAGTGGSGTVTVDGSATTQLIAANEIELFPEFEASVTSGIFSAELYTCYSSVGSTRNVTGTVNLPTTPPAKDMEIMKAAEMNRKFTIFPSVSTGLVKITGAPEMLENVELEVYNLSGRKVLQVSKRSYPGIATINLSNVNNGVYLLQINQNGNITTQKIIIQK